MILETDRTYLREMNINDISSLSEMLQDIEVMYAYEHAFSDKEVNVWLNRQLDRYREYGYGLWAVISKDDGKLIGQCGITMQDIGDREVMEVGYIFNKKYWHKGYVAETAIACKKYAFDILGATEIYSIIRDNNYASQRVAERNGMTARGEIIKYYMGYTMPHILYSITRQEYEKNK